MDEEIERLVIGVRADTGGFARDIAGMKDALEQGVGAGAARAGHSIESALGRAVRTGKLGFDDLRSGALKALEEIASVALKAGIGGVGGGTKSSGGGLAGLAGTLLTAALGLPGRATGGPVSPGAAYLVGERGPELFVPTSSGAIAPTPAAAPREREEQAGAPRASPAIGMPPRLAAAAPAFAARPASVHHEVKVSIAVAAPAGSAPQALAKSGRQVARAVSQALAQAGG